VYHLVVFESDAATLDEIVRVLKIDDGVMRHMATKHVEVRHMATKHVEGSKTSAPRDDSAAPLPVATPEPEPVAEPEPEPELEPAAVAAPELETVEATIDSDEE
jgi:hypothetical protein